MGREKFQMPRRAFLTGAASLSGTFALSQETGVFDAVEAEAEAEAEAGKQDGFAQYQQFSNVGLAAVF